MKMFYYDVAGFEFADTAAFGTAWREAKAKAAEMGAAIYRRIVKDDMEQEPEVYCTGGCFLPVRMVKTEDVKVF